MRILLCLVIASVICLPAWADPGPKTPSKQLEDALSAIDAQLREAAAKQAYDKQVQLSQKAYELTKKELGEEAPLTQQRELPLAQMLGLSGDQPGALQVEKHMLVLAEKHGTDSPEVRIPLALEQGTLLTMRRYEDAEPLIRREVALVKKLEGERGPSYAMTLMRLSVLLGMRGEYSAAAAVDEQIVALYESIGKGPDDMLTALARLLLSYWTTNQTAKAEKVADRLLAIAEKDGRPDTLRSALLAPPMYAHFAGRDDLAAPRFKRAIAEITKQITRVEKANPSDPALVSYYSALGDIYQYTSDFPNSDRSYTKAVELDEKTRGTSPYASLLAYVKRREGKPKDALAILDRAATKLPKGGEYGLDQVRADILLDLGEVKKAEARLESWRVGMEQTFAKLGGKTNPMYGFVDRVAAYFAIRVGRIADAEKLLTGSFDSAESELQLMLTAGTEADHQDYFERNKDVLDVATSFALTIAPKSVAAPRLGLTTLLRRKGRVLDAAATNMATIRAKLSPEDKQLLDDLETARGKLAKLTLAGAFTPDYAKQVADHENEIQKLEIELSKKSAAYRAAVQSITLSGVQKLIPAGARLVEIVNFKPFEPNKTVFTPGYTPPERRYAAYVLAPTGEPLPVDLGPAPAIDAAVAAFRKALANPKNDRVGECGRALYDLTISKIAPYLGKDSEILIAPDGMLNLVPFAAVSDEHGEYLIKRYTFTYLTSGRDLFRLAIKTKPQGRGVIFADPSFDAADATGGGESRGVRAIDFASMSWPQLPGTHQEAERVTKAMKGLALFDGKDATEGRLKQLHGPRILHLATHGFFLEYKTRPNDDSRTAAAVARPRPENPLLRSGLVLAGANQLESGNDDGILTAMEASALDLWGTKLVVLSACQTGSGKATNGDGVYGLRRALVIAGAEGLVMSLWQVDDLATRDLMTGFYERLAAGRARSSALRESQLELLANPKYQHPYFWAAFVPAGANSPLK